MFSVVLPIPPTSNNLFVNNPRGGRFPSSQYRAWQKSAAEALERQNAPVDTMGGRLTARYGFRFPDNRRRDIENFCKSVSDFLAKSALIEDDSQIDQLLLVRLSGDIAPGVYVEVRAVKQEGGA